MKRILVLVSIMGILWGAIVWAGSLTIPNAFQSGEKAVAAEVNANFNAVAAEVSDNATNISTNSSSITDLADKVNGGVVSVSFVAGVESYSRPTDKFQHEWSIDEQNQWANADTSLWWEGRTMPATATSLESAHLFIPIQLPDGATITELGAIIYDEKDDGQGTRVTLRRSVGNDGVAGVNSTQLSLRPQYISTTNINPASAVVDNSTYSYHIRGNLYGESDIVLISAFVKYEFK